MDRFECDTRRGVKKLVGLFQKRVTMLNVPGPGHEYITECQREYDIGVVRHDSGHSLRHSVAWIATWQPIRDISDLNNL